MLTQALLLEEPLPLLQNGKMETIFKSVRHLSAVFSFSLFSWSCSRFSTLVDGLCFSFCIVGMKLEEQTVFEKRQTVPEDRRKQKRPLILHIRQMLRAYQNSLELFVISRYECRSAIIFKMFCNVEKYFTIHPPPVFL